MTEPLAAVLVFSSLLAYLDRRRAAAVVLFSAALFAKETAIVVPALIFALEWLFSEKQQTISGRSIELSSCALKLHGNRGRVEMWGSLDLRENYELPKTFN